MKAMVELVNGVWGLILTNKLAVCVLINTETDTNQNCLANVVFMDLSTHDKLSQAHLTDLCLIIFSQTTE